MYDASGTAITPASLSDYQIFVHTMSGDKLQTLAVFKKTPATGEYPIATETITDPATNMSISAMAIVIKRELTKQFPIGKIFAEPKVKKTATGDFTGGIQALPVYSEIGNPYHLLGEIVESNLPTSFT